MKRRKAAIQAAVRYYARCWEVPEWKARLALKAIHQNGCKGLTTGLKKLVQVVVEGQTPSAAWVRYWEGY